MASGAAESGGVSTVIEGNPIINNAFAEPTRYWHFSGVTPEIRDGRRTAGYLAPSPDGQLKITDDVIPLALVNDLRDRVRQWRADGYAGATTITRDLFRHWFDDDRVASATRPFFCQQEAVETIVFLVEAPDHLKVGVDVPGSGEAYARWAVKMATGTGKTMVMALVTTWSGLNKAANRQDTRFADQILVIAPNITVRDRLARTGGIDPTHPESLYIEFGLIPPQYSALLGQIRVQVMNWHGLAPKEDPKRSVLKRGRESDAAFCRRVLTDLSPTGRVLVLNDEAHHAYRFPPDAVARGADADELREATVWIDGLERIHRRRGVLRAIDLSATPMFPGMFKDRAWRPFEWIISDFALVDAIESGLVKIPRTPTADDAGEAVPKYRNLWEHIRKTLPKRNQAEAESHPMMDYLAEADGPLKQLAAAWEATFTTWEEAGRAVPPAMVVIAHDTTVARLLEKHIAEIGEASPMLVNPKTGDRVTIRIDSDALAKAEAGEGNGAAEQTREIVATVGRVGKPGEQVRCLISVAMLSEGWDARNVTQILGLRAFASQLLCEQVVGRGLRRSSMSDLSQPEFVDIYGVPFQLLPMAKATGGKPSPPPDYTNVHTVRDRPAMRIEFPRLVQVVPDIQDTLSIDLDAIEPIRVTPRFDPTQTWVEFDLGTPHGGMGGETQDRERAYENFRVQRLLFRVAAGLIEPYKKPWLFPQALRIARQVIRPVTEGGKIDYADGVDPREICNLRYLTVIRERLSAALRPGEGPERFLPALDEYQPTGTTDGLNFNAPTDRCVPAARSHLSHAVVDSGLERKMCAVLDAHDEVQAWVKNHKLFLEIPYLYFGITHRYRPDFVVRMKSGLTVLLEGKGIPDEKDDAKATAARRWIEAVNTWNGLGTWIHRICYDPGTLDADLSALHRTGLAPAPRGETFPPPSDEEHGEDLRRHGRPDRHATR
ncbi:DEAD/DEAH box helicase family protein [Micromonospora sp. RTP1Z1]|uniref:DEAD/DEAH box helicase family protein n=1 Tax=Micromonospora sp. RTP1Z1 TaxID=2994043 RepID=UPI0029C97B0C|nr:DEAD/DEAH box helicase family protein [Micromonospora sp. RTP1Z1]